MPESSSRKKSDYTPPTSKKPKPIRIGSARWVAPLMVFFFVVGLLWIVAFYIAPEAPLLKDLSYWNVIIGFGLIACGFMVSTKWK